MFTIIPYLLQKYSSADLKSTNFTSCLPLNFVFFLKVPIFSPYAM